MADYYSSDIRVYGTKEELDVIEKVFEQTFLKKVWPTIRNVVDGTSIPGSAFRGLDLRGYVTYCDREADNEILISMEEIGDGVKVVDIICRELGLNVKTLYLSVLTCEGTIITNDPEYKGKWLFDASDPQYLPAGFPRWDYDFISKDELIAALKGYFGDFNEEDINKKILDFEDRFDFVSINPVSVREDIA